MELKRQFRICLAGLLLMVLLAPAAARAATKTAMPQKITESRITEDYDDAVKTNVYTVSYDGSGRIKKINIQSFITDNSWYYTFGYKKSGANISVSVSYHDDEDNSPEGVYRFNAKGLLVSRPRSGACSCTYYDKKKTKLKMLTVKNNIIISFTKKELPETILSLNGKKYDGAVSFLYKNGQISETVRFEFAKPVAKVTEKLLNKSLDAVYTYSTKTKKVSMSAAVQRMNRILLLDYAFYK